MIWIEKNSFKTRLNHFITKCWLITDRWMLDVMQLALTAEFKYTRKFILS